MRTHRNKLRSIGYNHLRVDMRGKALDTYGELKLYFLFLYETRNLILTSNSKLFNPDVYNY